MQTNQFPDIKDGDHIDKQFKNVNYFSELARKTHFADGPSNRARYLTYCWQSLSIRLNTHIDDKKCSSIIRCLKNIVETQEIYNLPYNGSTLLL